MTPSALEFDYGGSLLYAGVIYVATITAAGVILASLPRVRALIPSQAQRAGCLDGLRGVLAVGVLIHHSFTAYRFFVSGHWDWSSNALLNQLGQSTVALFFMVTGYLFASKLLESRTRQIRWLRLYESRLRRLAPLYLLTVAAVLLSVAVLTHFTRNESPARLAREVLDWSLFVIPGRPDINRLPMTWTVIAGVNWSLAYEWVFYACLPLLFWPLRWLSTPLRSRVCIALFCGALFRSAWHHHPIGLPRLYYDHFACGICAALILRDSALARVMRTTAFKAFALACLVWLLRMKSADDGLAVALTLVVFLAAAAGASLFGLLRFPPILWLGEISYGIYLVHGLALYWTLHALTATDLLSRMDVAMYAALVAAIATSVVCLASASFLLLERPIMSALGWGVRSASRPPVPQRPEPTAPMEP